MQGVFPCGKAGQGRTIRDGGGGRESNGSAVHSLYVFPHSYHIVELSKIATTSPSGPITTFLQFKPPLGCVKGGGSTSEIRSSVCLMPNNPSNIQ